MTPLECVYNDILRKMKFSLQLVASRQQMFYLKKLGAGSRMRQNLVPYLRVVDSPVHIDGLLLLYIHVAHHVQGRPDLINALARHRRYPLLRILLASLSSIF